MRKYLLPENVNWYRANMHCHSTISDGSLTPEELKKILEDCGFELLGTWSDFDFSPVTDTSERLYIAARAKKV